MGMIEDGLAMLHEAEAAEASVGITYHRGADSVDVSAVPTKPPFMPATSTTPPDPAKAERNFSILADALVINNVRIKPVTTDQITEEIDDVIYVYKVSNPVSGTGCWEWETGYMNGSPLARILVHTKYSGVQ